MTATLTRAFSVVDAEQRSPEWFLARLGRLTGSRAADMLATIKTGEAAARRDLRIQLVCERLTQTLQEDAFVNAAMQRGIELEPAAFRAYEALTGDLAQRTGFLAHDTLAIGCWVSGAQWADFFSYDDRFPPPLQTFLVRVHRSDVDLDAYISKALAFLDEVAAEVAAVKGLK